jgi:hypothetical protein
MTIDKNEKQLEREEELVARKKAAQVKRDGAGMKKMSEIFTGAFPIHADMSIIDEPLSKPENTLR